MSEYESRSGEFQQLVKDVSDMKDDIHDVKMAVVGNEKLGIPGLSARVNLLEVWRRNLDLRIATMSGGVFVVLFAVKYFLTGKL